MQSVSFLVCAKENNGNNNIAKQYLLRWFVIGFIFKGQGNPASGLYL